MADEAPARQQRFSSAPQEWHWRLPIEIALELHCVGQPMCVVRTEELNGAGASLILNSVERPAVGTPVRLRVLGMLGEGELPPLVDALVVDHAADGVTVEFK